MTLTDFRLFGGFLLEVTLAIVAIEGSSLTEMNLLLHPDTVEVRSSVPRARIGECHCGRLREEIASDGNERRQGGEI